MAKAYRLWKIRLERKNGYFVLTHSELQGRRWVRKPMTKVKARKLEPLLPILEPLWRRRKLPADMPDYEGLKLALIFELVRDARSSKRAHSYALELLRFSKGETYYWAGLVFLRKPREAKKALKALLGGER